MAVNEVLTARVREALAGVPRVEEKRMFRGITFMVDGKMCVSVGDDRIMCRIDPDRHAEAVARPGCRTVEMGGRPYIGFVYVDEKRLGPEKELRAWVDLALEFNSRAKASGKSRPGRPSKAAGGAKGGPARKAGEGAKSAGPAKGKASKGAKAKGVAKRTKTATGRSVGKAMGAAKPAKGRKPGKRV